MRISGRPAVAAVLAAVLTAGPAGCSAPPAVTAPSSPAGERAYAHLAELQRITDAAGGTRTTPSPGYDAAVDHVAAVLRTAGWDVGTPAYEAEGESHRNVVAQTRTGDPAHVVMAGAHLDSVPDGPGINDNGSGVAALLQIAEQVGGSPDLPATVRLAFWGSEEDDLEGSTGYVDGLDDAGRAAVALYVNLDMVASPDAGYFVQGGTGDREEAGPPGSTQVTRVLTEELARVGVTAQGDVLDGLSDYESFVRAGIPTGGVFSGDDTEKTDAQARTWGGQADEEFDPCYHEECDRLDDIDRVALGRFTGAVGASLRRFAASTSAP